MVFEAVLCYVFSCGVCVCVGVFLVSHKSAGKRVDVAYADGDTDDDDDDYNHCAMVGEHRIDRTSPHASHNSTAAGAVASHINQLIVVSAQARHDTCLATHPQVPHHTGSLAQTRPPPGM